MRDREPPHPGPAAAVPESTVVSEPHPGRWVSAALILSASFLFSIMNVLARDLTTHGIPFLEVAASRTLFGGAILFAYARVRGVTLGISDKKTVALRVVTGVLSLVALFYAFSKLPVSEVTAITSITPILIAFFARIFLREKMSNQVGLAMVLGLAGVALVLRPEATHMMSGFSALLSAIFAAIALVTLRKLGVTESTEAVVVHFSLWSGLVLGLGAAMNFVVPTPTQALYMIALGAVGTIAQFLMTKAYRFEPAARVGTGTYLTGVLFSALLAILWLGEVPAATTWLGIGVLLASGLILFAGT